MPSKYAFYVTPFVIEPIGHFRVHLSLHWGNGLLHEGDHATENFRLRLANLNSTVTCFEKAIALNNIHFQEQHQN